MANKPTKPTATKKPAAKPKAKPSTTTTARTKVSTKAPAKKTSVKPATSAKKTKAPAATNKPVLLSGGNPQIAKGEGHAPVQAYLDAMPDWKGDVGRQLDALIVRTLPDVHKAVKWNSPFYGVKGQGWFLNFHCFNRYVRVAFFRGALLKPIPAGTSKMKDIRYFDVYQDAPIDEAQMTDWVRQAAKLPGWTGGAL